MKQHLAGPGPYPFTVHRLFYDHPGTVVSGMDTGVFTETLL